MCMYTYKMKSVAYLLLILALLISVSQAQKPYIVGGQNATIEQYPSLVQLEYLYETVWVQECGATILTSWWILSAAHCFDPNWHNDDTRIRAGATLRHIGGSVHYVEYELNHPDYGKVPHDADIGVAKLRTPLVYSPTIQKGTIVIQDFELPDNLPVIHAGWGTMASGKPADVLQDVTIYVVNRDVCAERYENFITPNMICAGILDVGGKDACQGDSGGPLYAGNVVVGIVAFGTGCGLPYYPGVNTRVASYTNWILANAR